MDKSVVVGISTALPGLTDHVSASRPPCLPYVATQNVKILHLSHEKYLYHPVSHHTICVEKNTMDIHGPNLSQINQVQYIIPKYDSQKCATRMLVR